MVPLLVMFAGFSQHRAHATSLAAIIPIAAVGATGFALQDDVGILIAIALGVGAIAARRWAPPPWRGSPTAV